MPRFAPWNRVTVGADVCPAGSVSVPDLTRMAKLAGYSRPNNSDGSPYTDKQYLDWLLSLSYGGKPFFPDGALMTCAPLFEVAPDGAGGLSASGVTPKAGGALAGLTKSPIHATGDIAAPADVSPEADPSKVLPAKDTNTAASFWTTPGGALLGLGAVAGGLLIIGSNMGTTRGRPRLSR